MPLTLLPPCIICLIVAHVALLSTAQQIPRLGRSSVTDYAPITHVDCPDISTHPLLRRWTPENQALHPQELAYVNTRATEVLPKAWEDWLGTGSQIGYNLADFRGALPKVAIAIPGGGLRAAQYGAACLEALDARNDTAKAAGTGGLLQVSSYITGLSGGSWITGSLFFNGWPTIQELVFGGPKSSGWMLDLDFVMPDGLNLFSEGNQAFFGSILWSVMAKAKTGIDTSLVDPWSRMISYRFLNQTTRDNILTNSSAHGAGQLWSDIPKLDSYQRHQTPFPIVVADSRPVGSNLTTILGLESVVYEITPLELASYDPSLSAGMNLTYAGTQLNNGFPETGSSCVVGLDQAGFVMGTSAGLFNQIFDFANNAIKGFDSQDAEGLLHVFSRLLSAVRTRANDVANWPSPFTGINPGMYQDSRATWLELIDGASNIENIPYGPLFVKARGVDVIVTAEGSADIPETNWPNGTALIFTKSRIENLLRMTHQFFPPIPSTAEDFIRTGVNMRPTFFGCDPKIPIEYPLVIYLPNSPPFNGDAPAANTATFKLQYTLKHTRKMFDQIHANMLAGFVPGTNDADPNWGKCLQCAAIDRARFKVRPNIARSPQCSACFKQYCYDPENPPSKDALPGRIQNFVDPDPQPSATGFIVRTRYALLGGFIGLVAFIGGLSFFLMWWKKRRAQTSYTRLQEQSLHGLPPSYVEQGKHDRYPSYQLDKMSTTNITIQPPSPSSGPR